jgi:hypothetical protein
MQKEDSYDVKDENRKDEILRAARTEPENKQQSEVEYAHVWW